MNCVDQVQQAIDYIENNLTGSLTPAELSQMASYSLSHFHRIFHVLTGESVKGYIRNRRLSEAARTLVKTDKKVVEIALEYRYETHESFTRAFKKMFHVSPVEYRRTGLLSGLTERVNLTIILQGAHLMEPKFVNRDTFKIIGVVLPTTTDNGENFRRIPEFWNEFHQKGLCEKIPDKKNTGELLGICADCDATGHFNYIIAAEVNNFDNLPAGMIARTIPSAQYAVFTCKGAFSKIPDTWKDAFAWMKEHGYEHAGSEDFELYDERSCIPENQETDIYIPIKVE